MSQRNVLTRSKKQKANSLLQQQQWGAAALLLKDVVRTDPRDAEAWCTLGAVHAEVGEFDASIACCEQATRIRPDYTGAYCNLGMSLLQNTQPRDAIAAFQRALQLRPDLADTHHQLGTAYAAIEAWPDAVACYNRALALKPEHAVAWYDLGVAFGAQANLAAAEAAYRRALAVNPHHAEAHNNLGTILDQLGRPEAAIESYRQAIRLKPSHAQAHYNLGVILGASSNLEEALSCYRRALAIRPDYPQALCNLGVTLLEQGALEAAIEYFRCASALAPNDPTINGGLLFSLNYHPKLSPADIYAAHRQWGEKSVNDKKLIPAHANDRGPERRLRIGYVSPDFYRHSVMFFFEPLLANHDQGETETYCYSARTHADAVTERLQQLAGHWRNIRGKTDDDVAVLIRSDAIDILVDLAGYTQESRLPIFALKPAPIQVTYLGYPNTTGLKTMDYRLTDLEADPIGQEAFHIEQLVRLPHGFLSYTPPPDAPAVTALPALTAGHVTFGSFNNLAKMTPEVIGLWAQILKAVPGSRLVIKNKSMKDGPTRERYLALFRKAGITEGRLDFVAWIPEAAGHLGAYARVDIALDTFPYHGTTTTCEALWMGVPVITLAGDRHASRVGVSLLTRVGLTELIGQTPEEYVKLAVELAGDTGRLIQLRAEMRERVRNSPLCDAKSFTRDLEAVYREMWRGWCADFIQNNP